MRHAYLRCTLAPSKTRFSRESVNHGNVVKMCICGVSDCFWPQRPGISVAATAIVTHKVRQLKAAPKDGLSLTSASSSACLVKDHRETKCWKFVIVIVLAIEPLEDWRIFHVSSLHTPSFIDPCLSSYDFETY